MTHSLLWPCNSNFLALLALSIKHQIALIHSVELGFVQPNLYFHAMCIITKKKEKKERWRESRRKKRTRNLDGWRSFLMIVHKWQIILLLIIPKAIYCQFICGYQKIDFGNDCMMWGHWKWQRRPRSFTFLGQSIPITTIWACVFVCVCECARAHRQLEVGRKRNEFLFTLLKQ